MNAKFYADATIFMRLSSRAKSVLILQRGLTIALCLSNAKIHKSGDSSTITNGYASQLCKHITLQILFK